MRRLTLFLALLGFALPIPAQRLPRTVIPVHYDLSFEPDFQTDRFQGVETIDVSIQQATLEIVLHAVEIDFQDVLIESGGKTQKAGVRLDEKTGTAILTVPEPVSIGPARIRISYTGILNDQLRGFYRGTLNGREYAASQMEATDARQAFPSFDEPSMKATFAVTLIIDQKDAGFSNGALISETNGPRQGKKTLRFATTPRMSSYLVALVVGDFKCLEGESDGIPQRVCSAADRYQKGEFALDASKDLVRYYNRYYGIRYPFGKLDHIGIADFRAGAMENAGAILYRDLYLLADERTTAKTRRDIGSVLAHEIAHMWFGDLVTMEWWDDIWLNEGFASWMGEKAVDAWKPEWKTRLSEVAGMRVPMTTDSLAATRKIRQQASSPAEIDELFDSIAYAKTAAVLSMIESYVGDDEFRKGINTYFDRHAWGNTTYYDFADAVSAEASKGVDRILSSFVQQPGLPLVAVSARCEGNQRVVTLRQKRFFLEQQARKESGELWAIPVCLRNGSQDECVLLDQAEEAFRMAGCSGTLFANRGGRGYYLSRYEPSLAAELNSAISSLTPEERVTRLRDELLLVRSGEQSVANYLSLLESLRSERERLILGEVFKDLTLIRTSMVASADLPRYREWIRGLLGPIAREIGWTALPKEDDERRELRAELLKALAYEGRDPEALRVARRLTDSYLRDRKSVEANLAASVVPLAALNGDAQLYDRYLQAWRNAKGDEEKSTFLYALAEFENAALFDRTLNLAISGEVRSQDAPFLLRSAFYNQKQGRKAGEFVRDHWDDVEKSVPPRVLPYVLSGNRALCGTALAGELRRFISGRAELEQSRSVKQTLEQIEQCSRTFELQSPKLSQYLQRR